ncbi:MAG: SGNH/GDSL hydrolase family protein [Stellaceae bacterium]
MVVTALFVAAGLGIGRAQAAETPQPAPPERIVVFGDSQAQGIAGGLERILLHDPHYRILNRTHPGASLIHSSREWLEPIDHFTAHETAEIAIVMFGANDRIDMRNGPGGHYLHFRTDAWRNAYVSRADEILSALKKVHLKVIWLGNPIARSPTYSTDMSYINGLLDQEATKFGDTFFPLWSVIVDAKGHYTAYGPDRNGVTERLRGDDGIHFTSAGYEVVAEKLMAVLTTMQPAVAKANPVPGANTPTKPSAPATDASANTTAKDPKAVGAKAPGG